MNPRLRHALFGLACLAQIAVPGSLVVQHELTRSGGTLWKFQTAPVDPNDPFRGRYVRLSFTAEREHVPFADSETMYVGPDTRMYAVLAAGPDGFARLVRLHEARPASGDYLDVFVYGSASEAVVRLPFDRYYLPEDRAPQVEREYFEASRSAQSNTYAEVRVRNGHAALTALVLGGKPVQ
jgi:uncharacterized membrane-anchored protein